MWHICDEAKYLPIVFYMYIYINIYTVVYRFIYMYDCVGRIKGTLHVLALSVYLLGTGLRWQHGSKRKRDAWC